MTKRARHPETVQRERAAKRAVAGASDALGGAWRLDYGWKLRLDEANGVRHYRDVKPGLTYAEVAALRDKELADPRYVLAWIFQKGPPGPYREPQARKEAPSDQT